MIQSVSSFRVANFSIFSASWDTGSLKYIIAYFGVRSKSWWNLLICFFISQVQWWYVTCFVPWSYNRRAKCSRRNAVWLLMKASERFLGNSLLVVSTWKTDGSKRVRLLTLLGPVAVFIFFAISLYLCRSSFSLYSRRYRWLQIGDVTTSAYNCLKADFIQGY